MLRNPVPLLTLSVAIVGSNALVLSPISGSVAQSFVGTDPAAVMTASAVYGLSTAVSALTLAPRADRTGAEAMLRRSLAVLVLALGASAAAPAFWMLCLAQALAGLAAGTALPAAYALAVQVAPKGRESTTLGIVLTGWTLSLVAGVSLSAVLADMVSWRGVYWTLAGLCAVTVLLVSRADDWGHRAASDFATSPFTALRVPGIGPILIVCAAYMVAFYGLYGYLGAHLQGSLGRSTALTGLAPLAYGLGFGVAAPLDRMIDRFGARGVSLYVFSALAAVYLAMAVFAASFSGLVVLCFAWGLANHLGLNLIVGRLTALDERQRGAVMGLYSATTYVCLFAGTVAFRSLFETYGFAVCAAASALCIVPALGDAVRLRRPAIQPPG